MLGMDGILAIGRLDGETVVYIDNPWLAGQQTAAPGGDRRGTRSADAPGARGRRGYGAYPQRGWPPVLSPPLRRSPGSDWRVVARSDLDAFRGPFLASATLAAGIALALILFGTLLFFAVGNPMLRRIREGEHRFRELFENMRSGATVVRAEAAGEDFLVTGFNRGAERIEGLARQEVVGRNLSEVFPGIRHSRLLEVLRRVWRTGHPEHVPAAHYQDERISGWRENYVYKLPSGEIVSLFEDVTDRKQSDEALKESEARWRSIIETHAQAIVIVDQKHEIRFVNKAAEELFGHSREGTDRRAVWFSAGAGRRGGDRDHPCRAAASLMAKCGSTPDALERSGQLPAVHSGRLGAQARRT